MTTIPGTNFTNEQLCADFNIEKNQLKDLDSNRLNEYGTVYYKNRQYDKALAWYIKSAIENNSFAESNIGELYHKGLGVLVNHLCALKWYLKSAKANHCKDCFKNIGKLFESGHGVPLDKHKALEWYRRYTKASLFASIRGGTANKLRMEGYILSSESKNKPLKQLIKETEDILEKEKNKLEEIEHKTGEKLEVLEQLKITYKLTDGGKKAWKDVPILIPEKEQHNLKSVNGSTVAYEDERINLKIQIRLLEQEKIDLETQIKQYQLLEKEKAKLERQIKEKDSKIKSLESDIEFHRNEKKTLRNQIKQKYTKINSLKGEITEWNMKTNQLKLQVKERDKKINSVQTENRSLKREKTTLGNQLKEKGDRINSLENEKSICHTVTIKQAQKIDTLNHEKGNLELVLKSKEDAIVVLNGENKNLSAANQAINVMLGTQQNQLETKASETESLKQNLEQQLANEKRRNKALEQENRRLRETRQMAVQSHPGSGYYDDVSQNDINYDTEYGSDDDNTLHRYRTHGS